MAGADAGSDDADRAARIEDLFDGCRAGDTELIMTALDEGLPVDTCDDHGNTMIMMAAYHGHAGTVEALITRGAAVDSLNDRGQSPVAGAVFKRHADVVRALLAGGADPLRGTPNARDTATFFEQAEILALIDQHLRERPR